MKLTPDDIINQNFSNKALGFNKDEVKAFLEIVAGEFEELVNENTLLKKQLGERDDRTHLISETRGEVREILSTLQQFSRDSLESSRQSSIAGQELVKKGDEIVRTASTMVGAEMEIKGLVETIQRFKEHVTELRSGAEFVTKEDLKRFISTVHKMKEDELERADDEAKRLVNEANQRVKAMIRDAESEAGNKREEAALIINEAHQRAEEILREVEGEKEKRKLEAVQIVKDAHEKARTMVRDAEVDSEKLKERAVQVVKDAQQEAKAMIRGAEIEAEKKAGEADQIIKDAHQRARQTVKDAEVEEEKIRIEISSLKKQHSLFADRIKEAIGFHLRLLGSIDQGEQLKEQGGQLKEDEAFDQVERSDGEGEVRQQTSGVSSEGQNSFSPFPVLPRGETEEQAYSPFVAPKK